MEEMLKVKNVTKYYGKAEGIAALDMVDFTVCKGEFVALTGVSGSGKSTLLKIIGLTERASSGKVYFNDADSGALTERERAIYRRRNIGFVYQSFNLIPSLNVRENVVLPLKLDGKKPDGDYIDYLINSLGLAELAVRYPEKLSGGEQQRVAIARAMAAKPRILLADEPTGNLDSKNRRNILELLKKANREFNQTIIMATHDAALAEQTGRTITLSDGRIIADVYMRV